MTKPVRARAGVVCNHRTAREELASLHPRGARSDHRASIAEPDRDRDKDGTGGFAGRLDVARTSLLHSQGVGSSYATRTRRRRFDLPRMCSCDGWSIAFCRRSRFCDKGVRSRTRDGPGDQRRNGGAPAGASSTSTALREVPSFATGRARRASGHGRAASAGTAPLSPGSIGSETGWTRPIPRLLRASSPPARWNLWRTSRSSRSRFSCARRTDTARRARGGRAWTLEDSPNADRSRSAGSVRLRARRRLHDADLLQPRPNCPREPADPG